MGDPDHGRGDEGEPQMKNPNNPNETVETKRRKRRMPAHLKRKDIASQEEEDEKEQGGCGHEAPDAPQSVLPRRHAKPALFHMRSVGGSRSARVQKGNDMGILHARAGRNSSIFSFIAMSRIG